MRNIIFLSVLSLIMHPVYSYASTKNIPLKADHFPFLLQEVSGNRPIIPIKLGRVHYHMMVHANADFYMQINHSTAQSADVILRSHVGAYGIQQSGKISALGRDEGILPSFQVGQNTWLNQPVSVFETPADGTGMLGLKWISQNNVIVDFPDREIYLNTDINKSVRLEKKIRSIDYHAFKMDHDIKSGKYYLPVTINGITKKMVVSMVASLIIDSKFAEESGVPLGAVAGDSGGPSGAVENNYYLGKPVAIQIGSWKAAESQDGLIEDIYAYQKKSRPEQGNNSEGGALGADFLISHHAIVDFGNYTLYLK